MRSYRRPSWGLACLACACVAYGRLAAATVILKVRHEAIYFLHQAGTPCNTLTMHVPPSQTGNYSLDELPDLPAAFGPPVPPEGVSGLLMVSSPTGPHSCIIR